MLKVIQWIAGNRLLSMVSRAGDHRAGPKEVIRMGNNQMWVIPQLSFVL